MAFSTATSAANLFKQSLKIGTAVLTSTSSSASKRRLSSVAADAISSSKPSPSACIPPPAVRPLHAASSTYKDPLDTIQEALHKDMQHASSTTPSSSKLALLGGPGVGKGTYGSLLAQLLRIPHISTGDLVRKELSRPLSSSSPKHMLLLHEQVTSSMNQGKLLPDHVILELLLSRLRETADPNVGFVLDGFPRTIAQAALLDDALGGVDLAVNFHLHDDVLVAKCLGRRVCTHCGKDYNLAHVDILTNEYCSSARVGASCLKPMKRIFLPARPPPQECASKLAVRTDDSNEAVVRERLRVYTCESKPLEQYYHSQMRLVDVDVGGGAEKVWSRLLNIVGELETRNCA